MATDFKVIQNAPPDELTLLIELVEHYPDITHIASNIIAFTEMEKLNVFDNIDKQIAGLLTEYLRTVTDEQTLRTTIMTSCAETVIENVDKYETEHDHEIANILVQFLKDDNMKKYFWGTLKAFPDDLKKDIGRFYLSLIAIDKDGELEGSRCILYILYKYFKTLGNMNEFKHYVFQRMYMGFIEQETGSLLMMLMSESSEGLEKIKSATKVLDNKEIEEGFAIIMDAMGSDGLMSKMPEIISGLLTKIKWTIIYFFSQCLRDVPNGELLEDILPKHYKILMEKQMFEK